MDSSKGWAAAVKILERFKGTRDPDLAHDEPRLLVQTVAQNVILCGGPTESFSQQRPVWIPKDPAEHDLQPIDVVYGTYDPSACSITIFIDNIRHDASKFGAEPDDLLAIVRLHEHAHAVAHLGSSIRDAQSELSMFDPAGTSAWQQFMDIRTSWFHDISKELYEFIAQALTYAALSHFSSHDKVSRMQKVFCSLEERQPVRYQISETVKETSASAAWPLILAAARGEIDAFRGDGFDLGRGLDELIVAFSDEPS